MKKIEFEELTEAHLKDVLDIYNWYVAHTTATWHYHALDEAEMRQLVLSGDKRYGSFIIRLDSEICGYVSIRQYKTREAYGDTAEIGVYLKNDRRGMGLGDAAVKHIEDFARDKGFHVLIASISGDNESSVRVFERNGFEKCAHYKEVGRKFGKLLDNVVYQKILN
jgi:L-amino acid N-acyltransferase YncA